jgi:hypothetical protein
MFVNNHTCALVLLFGINCPYECRNNCQMFAIRRVIFYFFFFQSILREIMTRVIFLLTVEEFLEINQSETRIACGGHVC